MKNTLYALLPLLLMATNEMAYGDYIATGEISGSSCSGFIIEKCSSERIYATKIDGVMYEIPTRYKEISSYRDYDKRCWIRLKSDGLSLFSVAIDAALSTQTPDFYTKSSNGEYKKVDVDTLTFNCIQR